MRVILLSVCVLLAAAGPAAAQSARATAYIFTTSDCPIANRYAPEIQRLHETFSPERIRFQLVYVNPRERTESIRAHADKFGYAMGTTHDPAHTLVKRFGITVTPEAAVVDASGRLVYRGRIDDRYIDIGVERPRATRRDLEEALTAIVEGRPVPAPTAPAVGCIVSDFQPVTFARDLAPVLFDKCTSCHRPDGPAPFSLLTYDDARQRAALMAAVTEKRFMPPYNAHTTAGAFVGQKRLTDAEIALFRRWAEDGAIEGDYGEMPPEPVYPDGWQLGTPDVVVTIPQPYVLPAAGTDVFRIFVIPLPVEKRKYVTGLEFHPGNARVVHHANIRLDLTSSSRARDAEDAAPGYDGLMARSAVYPDGHFLGWTPGQIAPLVPSALSWTLDPGTDLVVQLHMQPSGAPESVQPFIGLFFSDAPPTRTPTILRLGSQSIDIPAGEGRYHVTDSYVLPVDVELHAVQPHAHYRLREARGTAMLPDGSIRVLIQIDNWDFRWQHVYRYAEPIVLPKGTRLAMEYRYDNSADNPRNPQLPPQRVLWGQGSFDEMGDLWFQFVTDDATDRTQLTEQILRKMTQEDVLGYETMLRADPNDADLHDDVALLYLSLGQAADAVRHFHASAALKPARAESHFNLATALSVAGLFDAAVRAYREALRIRPDYAAAHNNLGSVIAAQGQTAEAIFHFRRATAADPANAQAHRNLAWYLSQSPDADPSLRAEAVAAGERAAVLTSRRDANVLEALAAAYAAAGMPDQARTTAALARKLRNGG